MFKEVNLELNHPTVKVAITRLENAFKEAKPGDCLLFIHGYGSTGKGGEIKEEVSKILSKMLKDKKIKTITKGEDFSMTTGGVGFNYEAIRIRNKYKELEPYAFQRNRGITVVEL